MSSKDARVAASIKYGVVINETSLIAYEKLVKIDPTQEPEFVKIPLN